MIIECRLARTSFFDPCAFGEPAWDVLLALYEASFVGRPQSIAAIGRRTKVKPTSMSRWVEILVEWHLAVRISDPHDRRTTRLALTELGNTKMREYIDLVAEKLGPI
jgi:DNA-binding MarR family transcriptional regulator